MFAKNCMCHSYDQDRSQRWWMKSTQLKGWGNIDVAVFLAASSVLSLLNSQYTKQTQTHTKRRERPWLNFIKFNQTLTCTRITS